MALHFSTGAGSSSVLLNDSAPIVARHYTNTPKSSGERRLFLGRLDFPVEGLAFKDFHAIGGADAHCVLQWEPCTDLPGLLLLRLVTRLCFAAHKQASYLALGESSHAFVQLYILLKDSS